MSSAPKPVPPSVNSWNPDYLEQQYEAFLRDPDAVPPDLRSFFQGFDLGRTPSPNGAAAQPAGPAQITPAQRLAEDHAQAAVTNLIHAYREYGHLAAAIDPFGRERPCPDELTPTAHGLTEADLDRTFDAGTLSPDGSPLTLRQIIEILDTTYCRSIGVEFTHISNAEERRWWSDRMEATRNLPNLSRAERVHILFQLHRAELFEKFCGKRYPGVKRFSLEGGDSLIPLLDRLIEHSGDQWDVEEILLAMSHRGRLNVLTNIIGKTYEQIFTEFDDAWEEDAALGGGDVKYHRGYSSNRVLPSGKHVWLAMASNPSHLEAVAPVALGRCRAKQRLRGDLERKKVIPVIMHGDAAVIGQGVVAETFNLAYLTGYTVGGTVHIVVNNLIGFTTGTEDARSSRYCTDMAKMIEAPVLHVNAEDPEAVVHAAILALDYRMTFGKDVVIDMLCYRRHGHNETDEAMFTQPLLYKEIKRKPSVLKTYAERLLAEKVISDDDMAQIRDSLGDQLDRAYQHVRKTPVDPTIDPGHLRWSGFTNEWSFDPVDTSVAADKLREIAESFTRFPDGFEPHPKLERVLAERREAIIDDKPFDWATAESLAVGSIILEGTIVRLSGQDSRRGTFSQRHAAVRDINTGEVYVPLNHVREQGVPGTDCEVGTYDAQGRLRQAKFCVYDSPLSEYAVLGFEYGFSLASPKILAMWEAQFGDFANGAQVVIDQFIASAEAKWQRWSGLTLLLPHGYEGQGPEHSSARLERFLKLCGQQNIQVCYPSTPAQYFHMLRRQVKRQFRKPLVVMTPKSLLRLPECRSTLADLTSGGFLEILDDARAAEASFRKNVRRVILCTGKVFYDLEKRRQEAERDDLAIVRVEQLYPLHLDMLRSTLDRYPKDTEIVWVQEEPKNMGAWGHMFISLHEAFGLTLRYIGRPSSATPATGSTRQHMKEFEAFVSEAVGAPVAVA